MLPKGLRIKIITTVVPISMRLSGSVKVVVQM